MPRLDARELQTFLVQEGLDADGSFTVEEVGDQIALVSPPRRLTSTTQFENSLPGVAGSHATARFRSLARPATESNFLRKPPLADVLAQARLLKVGKTLAVGEILLLSEGDPRPVAHVTSTYAIPPSRGVS